MRLLTVASLAVVALIAGGAAANGSVEARFALFKLRHGRVYSSPEEEAKRLAIYTANLKRAAELQLRNPEATFGENEFADVSPAEFKVRHNADNAAAKKARDTIKGTAAPLFTKEELEVKPKQVDWRKHGAVTPVKNQGQCGSCWAFSTTGNIEGQWFLAGHNLTSLSEQELVACDHTSDGCDGGFTGGAMEWLLRTQDGWITSEADYPYRSGQGSSPACELPKPHVAQIHGQHSVTHDENQMAAYLAVHGPLSICVDANTWQSYTSGIMTDCPSSSVDHCVLAVGYNLDHATPYWIVKNSWAPSWGVDGYVYVAFGSDQCAITNDPKNALVRPTTPPPAPTVPTPPPVPTLAPLTPAPATPASLATQKVCPNSTCDTGCTSHSFQQNTCLVNPDGVGVMLACRDDENEWVVYLWDQSQTCQGEYYVQRQAVNRCFRDDDGSYLYNECPAASSVNLPSDGRPPSPTAFGTTKVLPAAVRKSVDRYVQEHKKKAHHDGRH